LVQVVLLTRVQITGQAAVTLFLGKLLLLAAVAVLPGKAVLPQLAVLVVEVVVTVEESGKALQVKDFLADWAMARHLVALVAAVAQVALDIQLAIHIFMRVMVA
tara:strand:+ start:343 stop:654 length:312 start_codon:yes stop_codon:yes gene_type:complete